MNEQFIRVNNLSKHYAAIADSGISNLDFSVGEGQILAVIGESGSGKSTLLKCIYGLLQPDEGHVEFDNIRVKGPREVLIPGHPEMKMVTQDFSLNVYAKVYDNIASMLQNTDVSSKKTKTLEIMDKLRILHLKEKRVVDLSGGEQQRVAIARALVGGTRVLLLDEPFSQIDNLLKGQLRSDIKRLSKENGITIILVSHDPADGLALADQLLVIKEGRLLQLGEPESVYTKPSFPYVASMLGNAVVLSRSQAEALNIYTKSKEIAFYPEWVAIDQNRKDILFIIDDVYFKGYANEIFLKRDGITISVLDHDLRSFYKGEKVCVKINRYIQF